MSKQKIQLSDHFDYSRLIRFVLPCIGTMLFTSIYGIVDGLCVSNFVGKTAFAAVNLIMPVPMLVGTVGFMLGTGGSAIVGITLGEGDKARADRYFSLFMSTALIAIHGLYSPTALGFAAALACGCFTFLLGGGPIEMLFAFCGAGIGNFVRCKLTKHHFTLFLGITASVCSASLVYAVLLKLAEVLFAVSIQHEAGYICSMLFIIPVITLPFSSTQRQRSASPS